MSIPFTFHEAWGNLGDSDAQEIVEFWVREKALPDESSGRKRIDQIVLFARSADTGEVAGICSATPQIPPQLKVPLYYYRTFIGSGWRSSKLVYYLLKRASRLLEEYAIENDYPCIGILVELENPSFKRPGRKRKAVMWQPPFTYVGQSPRGLDMRVYYFRGAPLKSSS